MPLAVLTEKQAPKCAGRDISVLPVEMVARCFVFLPVPIVQRLPILHVSRNWRSAALTFPDVWSQIELSDSTPKGHLLVDLVLSQTQSFPFDFRYASYDFRASTTDISAVLQKHMHRMRSVHWSFGEPSDFPWSSPAPLLEHISGQMLYPIPSDFLGGVPGSLQSLEIRALRLPESCPALSTLKQLTAWVRPEPEDSQFLGQLFDLCPHLETLCLVLDIKDPSLLPSGPAPASLTRLQLTATDLDADGSPSATRLDVIALCSAWHVVPRIPRLELGSFNFKDTDLALALDGAVELTVDDDASGNRAVRIVGKSTDDREYTLHSYSEDDQQADRIARALLAHQAHGRLHALSRLTISSDIFHIFAVAARPLALLSELTIVLYPNPDPRPYESDATRTQTFPCAHLSRLPPVPALETLCVDLQYRTPGTFGFGKHTPTAADLLVLAPVLRDSVEKLQRRVNVTVRGVPVAAMNAALSVVPGDPSITFLGVAAGQIIGSSGV